jgi:type III secretion protein S
MSGALGDTVIEALWLVLVLSAPPVVAAALVGLLVAIVQAATQLQEQTLQYALKFFVVVIALFVTGGLVATSLVAFSNKIFDSIGDMG